MYTLVGGGGPQPADCRASQEFYTTFVDEEATPEPLPEPEKPKPDIGSMIPIIDKVFQKTISILGLGVYKGSLAEIPHMGPEMGTPYIASRYHVHFRIMHHLVAPTP